MRNELQIFVNFVGGYCEITNLSLAHISSESESYSELCQRSKVESFAKIVNEFYRITIFKRNFILEILTGRVLNMLLRICSNHIQRALSIVKHSNQ